MNSIVFMSEHYQKMKSEIPEGQQGYIYVLKDTLFDEDDTFDFVLGHELIEGTKGFMSNPKEEESKLILLLLPPESDIKVVPFLKFLELKLENVNFSEFEIIARSTSPTRPTK